MRVEWVRNTDRRWWQFWKPRMRPVYWTTCNFTGPFTYPPPPGFAPADPS